MFTELQSHYLFEDRFGRPGKGNDKGKVEGLVGYVRRNFLVPIPSFESFDALNAYLEQHCVRRFDDRLRGHNETIGERLERDLEKLLPLPAVPYDASDKHATRVSSLSLVRYRTNGELELLQVVFEQHRGLVGHDRELTIRTTCCAYRSWS